MPRDWNFLDFKSVEDVSKMLLSSNCSSHSLGHCLSCQSPDRCGMWWEPLHYRNARSYLQNKRLMPLHIIHSIGIHTHIYHISKYCIWRVKLMFKDNQQKLCWPSSWCWFWSIWTSQNPDVLLANIWKQHMLELKSPSLLPLRIT